MTLNIIFKNISQNINLKRGKGIKKKVRKEIVIRKERKKVERKKYVSKILKIHFKKKEAVTAEENSSKKGRKLQKIRIRIIEKEIASKKLRKYLIMYKIKFFLTNGLKMNIVCLVDSSYIHIYQVYRFTSLQVYKVYKFTRFTRTILTCEQYEQDEPGSSIISTNCDECPCLINI